MLDRDEVDFPFRNWTRFRGLEGESSRLCEPALVRQNYLRRFREHREQLEEECRASRVELHPFVTDQPLAESLVAFLLHRAGIGATSAALNSRSE